MTNTTCLRCLTAGRQTLVPLTGDTYRCPVCGFAARIERVKISDIFWGLVDVWPGRVRWAAGQPHCLERIKRS